MGGREKGLVVEIVGKGGCDRCTRGLAVVLSCVIMRTLLVAGCELAVTGS